MTGLASAFSLVTSEFDIGPAPSACCPALSHNSMAAPAEHRDRASRALQGDMRHERRCIP